MNLIHRINPQHNGIYEFKNICEITTIINETPKWRFIKRFIYKQKLSRAYKALDNLDIWDMSVLVSSLLIDLNNHHSDILSRAPFINIVKISPCSVTYFFSIDESYNITGNILYEPEKKKFTVDIDNLKGVSYGVKFEFTHGANIPASFKEIWDVYLIYDLSSIYLEIILYIANNRAK